MRRTLHFLVTVAALIACASAGTAVATDYPLTLTDELGREVTLPSAPQRIVTMIPSHTETACALSACDRLVGVDQFSNHPPGVTELPDFGSAFSPNIEGIVDVQPDLVLVDESSGIAESLAQLGLTVYAGTPQTLDELYDFIHVLGAMLDRETEAAVLVGSIEGEIEAVERLVQGRDAPRVYYELDETPYSVGPNGFIGILIARAGGDNIVREGMGDFPQLDPEFIVSQDPEIIVLADAPYGVTAESVAARPGWSEITAVREGDVVELDEEQIDILNRPGPRVAEAVKILARVFHPGLF